MTIRYLTTAETAMMIRTALSEAFPKFKFSVRSNKYAGGASITIEWIDGPNNAQVDAVIGHFKASYFDGMIDFQGSIYHMLDGQQVRTGADFIHTTRRFTDEAVQRAIDSTYRQHATAFQAMQIEKPTIKQYRTGSLDYVELVGADQDLCNVIRKRLFKNTDRLHVRKSPTAARLFVTHDDNYSKQCGSGMTAVPANL